jgi:hypothetical protein
VSITIRKLGFGAHGINLVPVRLNGSAISPQDICNQCSLTNQQADVTRYDPVTGAIHTHTCGQTPQWSLVPGEAVLVRDPVSDRTCSLTIYSQSDCSQ